MVISPAIQQPFMKKITGNDSVALRYCGGTSYALAGYIGKLVSKGTKSTEEVYHPIIIV